MSDQFELERFVASQADCYADVVAELRVGAKATHWMWFVFPQLRGLGRSAAADYFGLRSAAEARAYREHPILGSRLLECVELVLAVKGRTLREIFGTPDDMKFQSSMTLFAESVPAEAVFAYALQRYCGGERDGRTLALLARLP